jgi:HAD superfamily hydrolase (TIGR01509 family)
VLDLFDACIVSAEVGAEKPNPVIFEAALEELGVAPEETVHVGDDRRYVHTKPSPNHCCAVQMLALDITMLSV